MSSSTESSGVQRPGSLWIARSLLFRGQLNQRVELPDDAGRFVRLAIRFHESKRMSRWVDEISFTLGFAAFVVLTSIDGMVYKAAAASVLLFEIAIVVIPAFVWSWYGGWQFMKEDGWGWKPEYVVHRRRYRAIKR